MLADQGSPTPQEAFGKRVRAARLALSEVEQLPKPMNQTEFGKRFGLNQQQISRIEKGDKDSINFPEILAIAGIPGVDLHEFFTGSAYGSVSQLARDIDALELDHWGEAAVLETARAEAKRYAAQKAEEAKKLADAGLSEKEMELLRLFRSAPVPEQNALLRAAGAEGEPLPRRAAPSQEGQSREGRTA